MNTHERLPHTCRGCNRFTYTAECMHCGETWEPVPDTADELLEAWGVPPRILHAVDLLKRTVDPMERAALGVELLGRRWADLFEEWS